MIFKCKCNKCPNPDSHVIGNFEVDAEHQSGFLDITFKMVCDGIKPQTKTLRVEWNGKWRSRKSELLSALGYEWIENE